MLDFLNFKGKNTRLAGIGIFIVFLCISLSNIERPALDETKYHYPNVINFHQNGLSAIFNSDYSVANTPLPYIIISAFSKFLGPSVSLARIITCLVSVFSFLLIVKIFIQLKVPEWYSLAIILYPYFFANSFIFYAMNYGILFLSAALLLLIQQKQNYLIDFITGILLSLAVLCQQFYIVIPAALILTYFTILYRNNDLTTANILKLCLRATLLAIPLILPALIFKKWGGLTHPNFRVHTLSFYPSTLIAILAITGLYSIPYLIQFGKTISLKALVVTFPVSLILVLFFQPQFTDKQGAGMFTGITIHAIYLLNKIAAAIPIAFLTILTCSGLLTIFQLAKKSEFKYQFFLLLSWSLLALAYATNTLIGERHLLPLMVVFLLMILPYLRPFVAKYFILIMAFFGVTYFLFFDFIKNAN